MHRVEETGLHDLSLVDQARDPFHRVPGLLEQIAMQKRMVQPSQLGIEHLLGTLIASFRPEEAEAELLHHRCQQRAFQHAGELAGEGARGIQGAPAEFGHGQRAIPAVVKNLKPPRSCRPDGGSGRPGRQGAHY